MDVNSFADAILSIVPQCRVEYSTLDCKNVVELEIDHAMRLCAVEYLDDYIYERDDSTLDRAYDYTHPNLLRWEPGSELDELMPRKLETSLDHMGRRPVHRGQDMEYWVLGINAALAIVAPKIGLNERVEHRESSQVLPAGEVFGAMLEEFQVGRYPSRRYFLSLPEEIPEQVLRSISRPVSPAPPIDQLTDLLSDRSVLVDRDGLAAFVHFKVLITGLAHTLSQEDTIKVIQIEHTETPNGSVPVSLAVLIPATSILADYSTWNVFYKVDLVGRWKSQVWKTLEEFEHRISRDRIEGIEEQALLDLCDSQAFRYVSDQWELEKETNSTLRGMIPEFLSALLLVYRGFHPVKISVQPRMIGELDAIGFRNCSNGSECLIVEVKKQSARQQELQREMTKLERKVELASLNRETLAEQLGCPGPIHRVSGIFISMARLGSLEDEPFDDESDTFTYGERRSYPVAELRSHVDGLKDVEFWDYNRFVEELNNAGLPQRAVELLQHVTMTWESANLYTEDWSDIDYLPPDDFPDWYDDLEGPEL